MKNNINELNRDELEMANGGNILDGIGGTIGWTYDNIIKPVGSYVVNTVQKVIELPLKPLKDKLDELPPVKPVYIAKADR